MLGNMSQLFFKMSMSNTSCTQNKTVFGLVVGGLLKYGQTHVFAFFNVVQLVTNDFEWDSNST